MLETNPKPDPGDAPLTAERRKFVLSQLERGNLSALNCGVASNDAQYDVEEAFIPSLISAGFLSQNSAMCMPFLTPALRGDSEARRFYEINRVILLETMPTWSLARLEDIRRQRWNSLIVTDDDLRKLQALGSVFTKQERIALRKQRFEFQLEPATPLSFASGNASVTRLEAEAKEFEAKNVVILGLYIREELTRLGTQVNSPGPLADRMRTLIRLRTASFLRARLVEDFVSIHQIDIIEKDLSRFLSGDSLDPWDFAGTPLARYGPAISHSIRQNFPDRTLEQRSDLLLLCLRASQPERTLANQIEQQRSKAKHSTRAAAPVLADSLEPDNEPIDPYTLGRVGIAAAVRAYHPECSEPERAVRSLANLVLRGWANFETIITRLTSGESPALLISEAREKLREPLAIVTKDSSSPLVQEISVKELPEKYDVRVSDTVREYLEQVDARTRLAVQRRLLSIEKGNFGDIAPLSAKYRNGSLEEIRIHLGSGTRIYFTRTGQLIELIDAGVKDTQTRDIARILKS